MTEDTNLDLIRVVLDQAFLANVFHMFLDLPTLMMNYDDMRRHERV